MKKKNGLKALLVGLFLLFCWSFTEAAEVKVVIDFPPGDSSFSRPTPYALIAGRAQVEGAIDVPYDVAVVIDRSRSTAGCSGADVDGDGLVGEAVKLRAILKYFKRFQDHVCTDPDDSILSAEVAGTVKLIRRLDLTDRRVSVVGFSGEPFQYERGRVAFPPVVVELPLTSNAADADIFAYQVLAKGSFGGTNIAAAIRTAAEELTSSDGVRPAGLVPRKFMLLLSDGWPTLPAGRAATSLPEDQILAIRAAYLARQLGIKIHTYALGLTAFARPFTLTEVARLTGGRFTPVSKPSEIIAFLEDVNLIHLDSLTVENVSLGKPAAQLIVGREGFFIAKVPVEAGINIIKATALAIDGSASEDTLILRYLETREAKDMQDIDLAREDVEDLRLELQKDNSRFLLLHRSAGEEHKALEIEKAPTDEKDLQLEPSEKKPKMDLELEPR